jgi:RNAse (barnase) inhibitor barstar
VSTRGFDPDLTRPGQNGVYYVGVNDLDRLAKTALKDELRVCRTDLAGCRDKDDLLQRMAVSLELPASFGDNWDALADCLRDLRWMPAWGYVLLFEHADELRSATEADFDILLGILDDAATFGSEHEVPWFAFLSLPDDVVENSHAPA